MTEVSDLSTHNALTSPSPARPIASTVPSIRTRRADTTVEIPSGGSLAMAGMIQDQTKQQINGLPGLMELPVLGPLFKSNDYINQQTELMVLVTPYVVRAVAQKDLSRPDDGFADPSDPARCCSAGFNRIYGVGGNRRSAGQLPRQIRLHPRLMRRKEKTMQNVRTMIAERRASRAARRARPRVVAGCALFVCGCNTDQPQVAAVPDVPTDYRLRHPISIREADRTLEDLRRLQPRRARLRRNAREVLAFAQTWRREATGGVLVDLPVGIEQRARRGRVAARDSLDPGGERRAGGRRHRAQLSSSPRKLATVRVTYPKITAQAGPCGVWPQDIGPSFNRDYFENQPYWNFGCASQRNLAAMVANPADLVQPRAETPIYTARQTTVVEKYRQGARPRPRIPTVQSKLATSANDAGP